jgi:integrase
VKLIGEAPQVEMPKLPKKSRVRKTDQAGYLRILNAAPEGQWRLLISTAWHTGMRRGELLALEWSGENETPWLDLARGRVWLPAEWCKADADSWLPLHPDLLANLTSQALPSGPVFTLSASPNEVSRSFTKIALAAGVPITLHDLRRSFGSRYASKVPAQVLQRLMRHSSISTTLKYYVDLDDALEEAILLG